jgi:hypothetical protein
MRKLRRATRFLLLFAPLLLFILILTSAYYSARLSLILHGLPFARVVPKENLDVFQFVSTDNMRSRAIVFSGGRAVGWIYQPMAGFARFVAFSRKSSFEEIGDFDPWFDYCLLLGWSWRWWLLEGQIVVLLLWFGLRKKRVQHET